MSVRVRLVVAMLLGLLVPATAQPRDRVALVIANAAYPDDEKPLAEPLPDARGLADELRRAGFEVIVGENLGKQRLRARIEEFKSKIATGSTALLFYSGYGIQSGRQSFMIPVDAQIWQEADVRRDGTSIETVVGDMDAKGAAVKLVVVDAARRNPYERRFRGFSAGLAPLNAPSDTLVIYSAATDKLVDDSPEKPSLFVGKLLEGLRTPELAADAIFNSTKIAVSQASRRQQVPWVATSLTDRFFFHHAKTETETKADPKSEPKVVAVEPKAVTVEPKAEPAPPKGDVQAALEAKPDPKPQPAVEPLQAAKLEPKPEAKPEAKPEPKPEPEAKLEPAPQAEPPAPAAETKTDPTGPVAADVTPDTPVTPVEPGPVAPPQRLAALEQGLAKELTDAIKRDPRNIELIYRRGQVLAEMGEFALARDDFGQVVALKPNHPEALNNRCFLRAVLGDLDGALADCNASLLIRPDYADALDSRGLVNLKQGKVEAAIADYDRAIELKPKLASAWFGRGTAKLKKGANVGGKRDIERARQHDAEIEREFAAYGIK